MLGLDSKLHPSNRQRMLNEDLTQFMHSLSQATTILSDVRQPEVAFFSFLDVGFAQIFSQIVSIGVKKLSSTNYISSRHIKRKKALLPVDVPSLKNAFA